MKKIIKILVLLAVLFTIFSFAGCSTSSNSDSSSGGGSSKSDDDYFTGEGDYNGFIEYDGEKGRINIILRTIEQEFPDEGITYYAVEIKIDFHDSGIDWFCGLYIKNDGTEMVDSYVFKRIIDLHSTDGGKTFTGTCEWEDVACPTTIKKKE